MRKTVYYVEFFDSHGNPAKSKPYGIYNKPGPAKGAAQTSLHKNVILEHETPVGSRVYELTGDLVLIEEYGTVAEHIEGQGTLF